MPPLRGRHSATVRVPSTAWTPRATSETSESSYVTKRVIVASASSSIGHDSTAGERPASAN